MKEELKQEAIMNEATASAEGIKLQNNEN